MKPKFQHDCSGCQFLGHFEDHDVYLCLNDWGGASILARYSDDGPDYASTPLSILRDNLLPEKKHRISGTGLPEGGMLTKDYLFSEHVIPYQKAMLMGLLVHQMNSILEESAERKNAKEGEPFNK